MQQSLSMCIIIPTTTTIIIITITITITNPIAPTHQTLLVFKSIDVLVLKCMRPF
jgi:hypothetical protein